jgi:hypothetical protein
MTFSFSEQSLYKLFTWADREVGLPATCVLFETLTWAKAEKSKAKTLA